MNKSMSQFKLIVSEIKQNKFALFSFIAICTLYFMAIFADFISPYSYDSENRLHSYAPPTKIHLKNLATGKLTSPLVYGLTFSFDEYKKRIYKEDKKQIYRIKFFVEGDEYKLLGFIPARLHLFGVEDRGRIYLWGADSRGRDLFSRILYGARISLSIGLIGVLISFFIGLLVGGISGYYGGFIDSIIMRLCEMIMMIPGFYLKLIRGIYTYRCNILFYRMGLYGKDNKGNEFELEGEGLLLGCQVPRAK